MVKLQKNLEKSGENPAEERKYNARGERARGKLKAACTIVLERVGYHNMRVGDVTKEAGVAAGLFYHYFSSLEDLTLEVLVDFLTRFEALEDIEKGVPKGDSFAHMLVHYTFLVDAYADHPGLMRCLFQFGDEVDSFDRKRRETTSRQLKWLADKLPRMFPAAGLDKGEALLISHALSGVGELLLKEYYILRDPVLRESELSKEEMAEFLAVLFYRGLFLENPAPEKLKYNRKLTSMRGGVSV